jgi:molybdenum cofactor biosynthesis enzyme MoaA
MLIRNPYVLLKLASQFRSFRLKCIGVLVADFLRVRHLSIRIDPILACNLRCRMCHFSSDESKGLAKGSITVGEFERIAKVLFPKAVQVVIGTAAEPTIYAPLPQLVRLAKRNYRVPFVAMSTNGQLLSEELFRKALDGGLDEITISMHGITKETYQAFQPPASYERLHNVLSMLSGISRERGGDFALRINYTVNPDNFEELAGFFSVFGDYRISVLQVRQIFDLGETAYRNRDLTPYRARLAAICEDLRRECSARNIVLLSPSFGNSKIDDLNMSILKPLVLRYISPAVVWKEDFDWRQETYEAYCRRTGWYRQLLRMMFMRREDAMKTIAHSDRSLRYEVT